ncbi:molybdopterin-dependent oxidoreductase [Geminicoccus harenae]|uniref:molybdopterin-dependent oxidoreductase n=1 Tax=Geminicoccus harenae TaxID=2498453 RepID=UPI00168A420E|nr:molybdopterin-dependent oxidoreductase [Geminicoccus harenae]
MADVTRDGQRVAADEIRTTTCYMCACRCGIRVHLQDGELRFIDGNPDHPVNRGVLCAKGSAGIMQQHSPAKLRQPLLRNGPRGSGQFRPIGWDEALEIATGWLSRVRYDDPRKLAFFTGRDQSQALTGFFAKEFGTPNFAAHGGFCSVNMATAGMYTHGGSFWEFGEPDYERAHYFLMFGVAEDHDSNPIKLGLARLKDRGAKFVSVNPVRTGYSAIADEWLPITPGTDGLFVIALIHELLRAGKVDIPYLQRFTNSGWLVVEAAGTDGDGLFARDEQGRPLCMDLATRTLQPAEGADVDPMLAGLVELPDGRQARPVFELMARRYGQPDFAPDQVAERCGIPAATIRRIAAELADAAFGQPVVVETPWTDVWGKRHERFVGRPVAMHAMRGISAHSNGFHTCRSLHLLQALLGALDTPGSHRFETPYPKTIPPGPKPAGKPEHIHPGRPLPGMPLGYPLGPEDLLVDDAGEPVRIDKAYSWEAPLSAHGLMQLVIGNAKRGDPYRIDTLFMYMANMAWNSAMNTKETIDWLTEIDPATGEYVIPRIIYSDAFYSETVAYADLILPDTTYLERHDCISLLDRPIGSADAIQDSIRQPVLAPDRDVRPFQDVLIELGWRLGLGAFTDGDGNPRYRSYADYMVRHERTPGIGPLAGWRGEDGSLTGKGPPNPDQLQRYVENGCFFQEELPPSARFMKHFNKDYQDLAVRTGMMPAVGPLTVQLYSEPLQKFRLAGQGHGKVLPPERHRTRVATYFDPLPFWYPPFDAAANRDRFPLHAITQRPMAMYHAWHSQNVWLRQILAENRLYIPAAEAARHGLADDDWVLLESRHGAIQVQVRVMEGVNGQTVWTWNAIGKRAGTWGLDKDTNEARRGFLLNHLIDDLLPAREDGQRYPNADPVTGQAAWYDLTVRIEKVVRPDERVHPVFPPIARPPGQPPAPDQVAYGSQFRPWRPSR